MKRLVITITILLALSSVNAQLSFNSFNGDFSSFNPATSGIAFSDIITVANHYGCKTWNKNQCTNALKATTSTIRESAAKCPNSAVNSIEPKESALPAIKATPLSTTAANSP